MKWIILGLGLSFLPIWRGYGDTRHDGHNFWVHLNQMIARATWTEEEGWPHIPYSQARDMARRAYVERFGT